MNDSTIFRIFTLRCLFELKVLTFIEKFSNFIINSINTSSIKTHIPIFSPIYTDYKLTLLRQNVPPLKCLFLMPELIFLGIYYQGLILDSNNENISYIMNTNFTSGLYLEQSKAYFFLHHFISLINHH